MPPCRLLVQDTEWFESKRLKRGGRGGGRGGGRSGGRGSGSTGSFHASSSRGGLGGSTGQLSAAAAVGTFSGGTFTSGVYSALEDLEGGLEEEGLPAQPLLSPKAVAAVVPLNPVLEGLGELEPEEEAEKGEGYFLFASIGMHIMPQVSCLRFRHVSCAQLRCLTTWPGCGTGLQNFTLEEGTANVGSRSAGLLCLQLHVAVLLPPVGPTMMSKEARNLFLNGGGEEALAAWKVSNALCHQCSSCCHCCHLGWILTSSRAQPDPVCYCLVPPSHGCRPGSQLVVQMPMLKPTALC